MSDELYPSHDSEIDQSQHEAPPVPVDSTDMPARVMKTALPLVIIGVAVIIFIVLGAAAPPGERDLAAAADPEVEVVPVQKHEGTLTLDVNGEVVPYREIRIAAELSGKIMPASTSAASRNCRKMTQRNSGPCSSTG